MFLVFDDFMDFFAFYQPHQVVRVDCEVVVEADELSVFFRYLHQFVGLLVVFGLSFRLELVFEDFF